MKTMEEYGQAMNKKIETIGIIGGGQLGKMSAMAALNLGFKVAVLTDDIYSPAAQITPKVIVGNYSNPEDADALAAISDVITFEFENVDAGMLNHLALNKYTVHPSPYILAMAQDRLHEKRMIRELGLNTADFAQAESLDDLQAGIKKLGFPALFKMRNMGYDGKGQYLIPNQDTLDKLIHISASGYGGSLGRGILETVVDFAHEVSIIVARGQDGTIVSLPPAINEHAGGILLTSSVPSGLTCNDRLREIGKEIAEHLKLVGVLAIETFIDRDDNILINEIAPRPHNSGHWSMDCCTISQFEMHIRAITGLPLVQPMLLHACTMHNIIGTDPKTYQGWMSADNARVYDYGKKDIRPRRKMGHVNVIGRQHEAQG